MNKPLERTSANGATRREALTVGATLVGGALVVGCSPGDILAIGAKHDFGAFGPFIKIQPDGWVTVVCKHIEVGQGNHAGLAALVAEELDADWDRVKTEHAIANAKVYANSMMGVQGTGGSSAIPNSWIQLRTAGAAARAMFVQAAAARWKAPASEVGVQNGIVTHTPTGKQAAFADLLTDAAKVKPPQAPKLKDPKTFTLIGTDRVRRKDTPLKTTGQAVYTQDVHLPNMLTAMVAHAPKFGATVTSFDDSAARKVPGVVDVFQIPSGVAVVAQNTWAARQGRDAVKVKWDLSKAETVSTDQLAQQYADLAAGRAQPQGKTKWQPFASKGTAGPASPGAAIVTTTYAFPYLAHAAMEPMNCVAIVNGQSCHLMHASQSPTLDQLNAAKIVGNLPGNIQVDTLYAGGSFGRRTNFQSDYVAEAVHIAKHVGGGRPVKLVWTREDDMRAGYYRPLVHHAVQVALGADGLPATWRHRIVTQSIMKGSPMGTPKLDSSSVEGAQDSPYLKATLVVDGQLLTADVGVPVLWWRSVGATHTAFVMEHTVDQLAKAAGKDPVDYRRALYAKAGANRHLAALNLAAEKAGWGSAPPEGWTRGVAVHESFGSVVAQIADVKLENGEPKVGRVVTAIDCGTVISPDQVSAQMEGGTCYGLSAALYGKVDLKNGEVQPGNFDGYRVLRNSEAPTVETYFVASPNPPSGVGEPGTPVIAPAVANALLAMGQPPTTSLPFVKA